MRAASGFALILLWALVWSRPMVQRLPVDNSWPLLLGFVLAYWLGRPWRLRATPAKPTAPLLALGVILFAFGLLGELLVLAAIGWTLLLVGWVARYCEGPRHRGAWAMLPLFSFPWIATDFTALGWQFRLSGAWIAEGLFTALGFSIHREGTLLDIQGLPVAIEPACAGMNLLPALLLTGAAVGYLFLAGQSRFWLFIGLLVPLAWLANTLRICVITAVALTWGSQFASGFFHTWGALLVLGIMFGACIGLAKVLRPALKSAHFA
ncbi:exosortase/archaeosortase family protein [Cerasicoccus fimbriatus]|uniref:exosortase/archaeosortase family protein n=1 Tax=Cerasicoccus fimbriatus TaxID=3014554 RepID=UPI0022B506DD|nr:exosortase/archaeosortase family protein [Cerasicoccus sp. TK19100]